MRRSILLVSLLVLGLGGMSACDEEGDPATAPRDGEGAGTTEGASEPISASAKGNLTLPIDETVSSSEVAFAITQTGAGAAGAFSATNPRSLGTALLATSFGRGAALYGQSVGTGTGSAGVFSITNGNNSSAALGASTFGKGPAGRFDVGNTASTHGALEVHTAGELGALIQLDHPDHSNAALRVESNGSGPTAWILNSTGTWEVKAAVWMSESNTA
jgi:hypothetical protein